MLMMGQLDHLHACTLAALHHPSGTSPTGTHDKNATYTQTRPAPAYARVIWVVQLGDSI